jgi:titin
MYTDPGVNSSNTYSYLIMATNTIPAASSPSNVAVVPAAPSNLTATRISSKRIDLSWSDNSNNESGFRIERKRRSEDILGGNMVESDFEEVATVMANVTSYINDDLARGTYFYRVRAFTGTGLSAYSNEASEKSSGRSNGGGGCSIGANQNTPTTLANGAMLLLPFVFIALMRLRRRSRVLSSDLN